MNADDLNNLPRYIEAPGSEMWRISDAGRCQIPAESIFVRLSDVLPLLRPAEKTIMQDGVEYVSVGMGGVHLKEVAKINGWELYAYGPSSSSPSVVLGPWSGDSESREYYIKKL